MAIGTQAMKAKRQEWLNKIEEWASQNGLIVSLAKTDIIYFTTIPEMHNSPELKMGEHVLPYTDRIKLLGLIWDSKLT